MFLIPLIFAIMLWKWRPANRVTSILLYDGLKPSPWHRAYLPFWLLTLAAMLAATAYHQPSLSYVTHVPEITTPNLAIAIDLSGSMHAVDWPQGSPIPERPTPQQLPPPRLETAKKHIAELLQNTPEARAALVGFAHNTVLVAPLTQQHRLILERLKTIEPEHFQDGTSIGQALMAAVRALKHAPPGPKSIILLSDGVDHSTDFPSPLEAAQLAGKQGIIVHTVAIGGKQALHPVTTDYGIRWENVGEPLDAKQLQTIAQATGGSMFEAEDASQLAQAISQIQDDLSHQLHSFQTEQSLPLNPLLLTLAALLAITALAFNYHESATH